jgi:outer membrane receptor protein involved in Fe transport
MCSGSHQEENALSCNKLALFGAAGIAALISMQPVAARAATAAAAAAATAEATGGDVTVGELVVTAQKREENIQNVGMSIQAASGERLTKLGITSTADLQKVVPGFEVTPNYYGTVVYTIRGVGFQDTSLAGSPTVTVYLDEVPLPFSILTAGATLDLQRVEVLKGPQGTLFGNNATAGAINYIANKPTETFQAGGDFSFGNFATVLAQAYVSGPLTDGLTARLAVQSNTSGAWQKGYGPQSGQDTGGQDFLNGRIELAWKPNDKFRALFTVSGWSDRGFNQVGQLYGLAGGRNHAMPPFLLNYPLAPHDDQSASWMSCVNDSPWDPIAGQTLGDQYLTPQYPDGTPVGPPDVRPPAGLTQGLAPAGYTGSAVHGNNAESESNGTNGSTAAVLQGAQPTHCVPMRRANNFFNVSLRMDYDVGNNMTVTSLTSFERFNRHAGVDGAGVPEQDYQSLQVGKITSVYQELRLSGKFWGKGDWIFGGNYQYDSTWDRFLQSYNGSTASPTAIPYSGLCFAGLGACTPAETFGNPAYNAALYPLGLDDTLGPTEPADFQRNNTYAVYLSGEYPVLPNLTLLAGVRYTEADKLGGTCGQDGGDGSWSTVASQISDLLELLNPAGYLAQTYGAATPANPINGYISAVDAYLNHQGRGINAGPGKCGTTGFAPYFQSYGDKFPGGFLNQSNVSWRAGANWKVTPETLLYLIISQGYKGGSFPTVAMSSAAQATPVRQENLIAYEGGIKGNWLHNQLTANGAVFYYDYSNKQILGAETDPVFGPLAELVNVPKSHVIGFELSGTYTPEWLKGLSIVPAVSYQYSHIDHCTPSPRYPGCIDGNFFTPDAFSKTVNVTGQAFPSAPDWQASFDAEYDWKVPHDITAFFGFHVTYDDATHTGFQDNNPPVTPPVYSQALTCGGPVYCYEASKVPPYTLLDLRAGIERGPWAFQIWGHNVTNKWYWTAADRVNDTILRYTGYPTTYGITISVHYR